MAPTYGLHRVRTLGSWPQTRSFHGSRTWEAQCVWRGVGGVCFIPETPVSWIPGTGIRVSKAEKALLSVLPTFVLVHLGKDSPPAFKGNVSKSPLPSCKF